MSRQTVYNEVGTKPALAEAMILRELAGFLAVVTAPSTTSRTTWSRRSAATSASCSRPRATTSSRRSCATHGADTELLPLLTTHSESLLAAAKHVVTERVATYAVPLDAEHLDAAIDVVVRVVLSHVMQPSASPAETSAALAWIASRVLRD